MYVTNFTDFNTRNDYDKSTDYSNITYNITDNCTNSENIMDIIIPSLLLTIPFCLSFLCLSSLMVYTLITPVITNK